MMSCVKDMWWDAQQELIGEYLEAHPEASDVEAHDHVFPQDIQDRFADNFADLFDEARQREKDSRI